MRIPPVIPTVALLAVMATCFSTAALAQVSCQQQQEFDQRPIDLGVSGGNIRSIGKRYCCSGTLGALVQNKKGTTQFILSNNHVLGRDNLAVAGEKIVEPGLVDNNCVQDAGDEVATFSRSIHILFTSSGGANLADASIAKIIPGDVGSEVLNIGPISSETVKATVGLGVQKMGRTSCLTTGTVTQIGVTILVQYPSTCNAASGIAKYIDQIVVSTSTSQAFLQSGDSGSLLLTTETCPRAVGLLFAANTSGTMAIANPINAVLKGLDVQMVGGCSATPGVASASAGASLGAITTSDSMAAEDAQIDVAVATTLAVKQRHEAKILTLSGVVGVGVGVPDSSGKARIDVFLDQNRPKTRAAIPASIEGVPVHIMVTGPFIAS